MTATPSTDQLRARIEQITRENGTVACAVAVDDRETGFRFSYQGDRVFHAASTIKVAILLALMKEVDEGRCRLTDPLLVRNRFFSAIDGSPYRLSADSDGYPQLYKLVGRTARIGALAENMIIWSSNLATNLLFDFIGVETAIRHLRNAGVEGVYLRRGVEDNRAHDQGVNNETTADGLVQLFGVLRSDFLSKPTRGEIIVTLLGQKFTSMIPAGLPSHASVAHKTGEISTACHDAGIVYLPEREPYILAILTEVAPNKNSRRETVAKISRAVFEALTGKATEK